VSLETSQCKNRPFSDDSALPSPDHFALPSPDHSPLSGPDDSVPNPLPNPIPTDPPPLVSNPDVSQKPKVFHWDHQHIHNFFSQGDGVKQSEVDKDVDGIVTNRLDIKLSCPIGKTRIKKPVRATVCHHIQPFDRDNFIKLEKINKAKKKKSNCPVCNIEINKYHLRVDSFFVEVLSRCGDSDEVVLFKDGSWHPMGKNETMKAVEEIEDDDVVEDDDDDDLIVTGVVKNEKANFIDLTDCLDDDDDDDIISL